MSLTRHLLKKDFFRLRGPLALFSLLVAGKCVFYASISGLFSAPDIEWLRRMQNGPEMLLRVLAEPVIAYLLVGWLVFEDSPVEQDAHWLTRPISGAQLFGVKLAGAILMFVLWPLALNVVWWVACGVGSADVILSAGEFLGLNLAFVAMGLACAALTGGFPRFILWSLVGVVVLGMAQLAFTLFSAPGLGFVRFVVCLAGSGLAAAAVAGHQFVTRRHRTSLGLVCGGLVVVALVAGAWRWDFMGPDGRSRAGAASEPPRMSLKLTGPARYFRTGAQSNVRHYAQVPVQIEGTPSKAVVAWLKVIGEWSFGGAMLWTSRVEEQSKPSFLNEAIRRQLGFAMPAEPDGQVVINLPFSVAMAQRAVRETPALQARVEVHLGQGEILAELPLRESRKGAYSVSSVSSGPFRDTLPGSRGKPDPVLTKNGVSLLLTENSARGLQANSSYRMEATHFALVNRRTSEFFLSDNVRSGPEALTVLNQAKVACWRLTFLTGKTPLRLDEMSLVVLRFGRGEIVKLELKADPVTFVADSVPGLVERPAEPDTARMAELLRVHAAGDRFMGSVLVAKGERVIFAQSAGLADLDRKVPNVADTRFRIGSLTKQFTAAAILLLQERGRLSVDDQLVKFMPGIPEAWRAVTLRQLLTHTSGIPNFTNFPEYAAWKMEPLTPEQVAARIRDRPLDFLPGEKFNYSNTGYVLLGRVVELAAGQDYGTYLRESVFLPLGMKDSGYEADVPVDPARAAGYSPGATSPVKVGDIDMHVPGGAGGLYSTTPDLLRWTQGLFGGKLLSPASLELMTTPVKNGYAFGLAVATADGRKVVAHAGAIDGFMSQLSYFPDDKMTVAVLANLGGAPVTELAGQLAEVTFGKTVVLASERREVVVPVAVLKRYVGVYQLTPNITNTVRLVDGRLTTQLSGQRAFPLFPESERRFFLKVVDAQVEFVMDEAGGVAHLLQSQGGRTQRAARIGDVVERRAIAVSPDILAAYAGRYELRPDFVITITLEDGRLVATAPGQGKSPLLAETETKFFSAVVDAQVEFVRDDGGAVTHLVLHGGGAQQKAPRQP